MQSPDPITKIAKPSRYSISNINYLTPDALARMNEAFHGGYLHEAARVWHDIENRDATIKNVISKRKKSISRLKWEIMTTDDSPEALEHKEALEFFYNHLRAVNAYDENEQGGLPLLIKQMMDAVGKKYAVHEIIFSPTQIPERKRKLSSLLTATFRFVPLWFFENRSGRLTFITEPFSSTPGIPTEPGSWLVTTGEGLMEASSIAYLFKHLPMRDWLIYCERNGMPGIKCVTDAMPDSAEWNAARDAVQDFGAEFKALMSKGTNIEAIDVSSKGTLPYQPLIEHMDRAITALWRGSDLSTMSKSDSTGVSLQMQEMSLLEEDDASLISDTLQHQVDKFVIKYLFDSDFPKACFQLKTSPRKHVTDDIAVFRQLWEMGVPLSLNDLRQHFGVSTPHDSEGLLPPANPKK